MNDQFATFSMSIAAFISAYLMSLVMIPHIIIWVKERNLMDDPNDRSSHIVPTPSMGGLSFVGTIMIFILLIPMNLELFAILIGSVILMAMGFIDDLNDLSERRPSHRHLSVIAVSIQEHHALFRVLNVHQVKPERIRVQLIQRPRDVHQI